MFSLTQESVTVPVPVPVPVIGPVIGPDDCITPFFSDPPKPRSSLENAVHISLFFSSLSELPLLLNDSYFTKRLTNRVKLQYQCMMKFSVGSEKIISKTVLSLEKD